MQTNTLAARDDLVSHPRPISELQLGESQADGCQCCEACLRELLAKVSLAAQEPDPESAIRQLIEQRLDLSEYGQLHVFIRGSHRVESGFVVVAGDARLQATGKGMLLAVGQASIVVRGSFEAYITDEVALSAHDDVFVDASGHARVRGSYNHVVGIARDCVRGTARGSSIWFVEGNARFDSFENARLLGEGEAELRGYDLSKLLGRGKVKVSLTGDAQGWFEDSVELDAAGSSLAYIKPAVKVRRRLGSARVVQLTPEQDLEPDFLVGGKLEAKLRSRLSVRTIC